RPAYATHTVARRIHFKDAFNDISWRRTNRPRRSMQISRRADRLRIRTLIDTPLSQGMCQRFSRHRYGIKTNEINDLSDSGGGVEPADPNAVMRFCSWVMQPRSGADPSEAQAPTNLGDQVLAGKARRKSRRARVRC